MREDLQVNCRLWLYSTRRPGVFGDGKVRLLTMIARQGSLRRAAAELGISYRKAWGDLRKAETCLDMALVRRARGGRAGGTMTLTEDGRRVLADFTRCRSNIERYIRKETARLVRNRLDKTGRPE